MENNPGTKKTVFSEEPISVSEYISTLNEVLSRFRVKLLGEVTEIKVASSGHVYFSLKDENTGDVMNCAIWRSVYKMCNVELEEGMKVIVSGYADIYRARGMLTFKVRTVELAGEGALKKAYEELKRKLKEEGVFQKERKRLLPSYPHKIGVITSKKGAAIHDFMNNLGKFGFEVHLCDSRVEGQEAVEDLLRSMKTMKKKDLDVLVIIRGGGSLQSLMAFDNENLVREVIDFPVPVISGIGHHEDIPLVSLASDAAESTPTGVANRLSEGFLKARESLSFYERSIEGAFQNILREKKKGVSSSLDKILYFFKAILEEYKKGEERIMRVVSSSFHLLRRRREFIANSGKRIKREFAFDLEKEKEKADLASRNIFSSFSLTVENTKNKIKGCEDVIKANDPERQLRMGYAIMRNEKGKVIRSVDDVKKEERISTVLSDGRVDSCITNIKKK